MPDDEAQRPDPDALLRAIEREQPGKGKLKIFFGMALRVAIRKVTNKIATAFVP